MNEKREIEEVQNIYRQFFLVQISLFKINMLMLYVNIFCFSIFFFTYLKIQKATILNVIFIFYKLHY